ncbi:MAG: type IVB secretion system protein IcmH/DotU [Pseudomonadota bacterium]
MSGNEPLDPFQDPDRTVLVPAPGGKRAAPAAPAATAAPEDATVMAPQTPPPARAAGTAAPQNLPKVPATLHGNALNPLVRAANPLLDLVTPLRHMTSYSNVEELRIQLIGAIKTFESEAKAAQVPHEAIAAARYSLCTFLDETISSTPWGGGGVWASRSLLVTFHNEAFGGEKFFLILQKLGQDARANLHILELMYLCLALGLEGRYRVIEGGRAQLEILRERLQQLIQKQRGAFEPELSVHWKGATGKGEPLWRVIPVWVLAAIAAGIFILLQLFFSFRLNQASDPVFASLHKIKVEAPLPPAQPVPAPVVARPVRVAGFLAPEIERGLVSVNETADRSVVTLRGDGVFASGSAEVTRDFVPLLQRIGDALKPVPGKVIVIGHTDNVKAGISAKFPSNWDLSKGRASSVKALLAERAGPPDRYAVEGRGDTEPLVANDSPANRARNRRVDIIVLTPPVSP